MLSLPQSSYTCCHHQYSKVDIISEPIKRSIAVSKVIVTVYALEAYIVFLEMMTN